MTGNKARQQLLSLWTGGKGVTLVPAVEGGVIGVKQELFRIKASEGGGSRFFLVN